MESTAVRSILASIIVRSFAKAKLSVCISLDPIVSFGKCFVEIVSDFWIVSVTLMLSGKAIESGKDSFILYNESAFEPFKHMDIKSINHSGVNNLPDEQPVLKMRVFTTDFIALVNTLANIIQNTRIS